MGLQADKVGVPEGVRLGKRETPFNGGYLWGQIQLKPHFNSG